VPNKASSSQDLFLFITNRAQLREFPHISLIQCRPHFYPQHRTDHGIPNYYRWLILAVQLVVRTMPACQFQTMASAAPFLVGSRAIDAAQLGGLTGLFRLPGIFRALPGGMLRQRFGAKRLMLTGLQQLAAGGAVVGAGCNSLLFAIG
jgi:hypothetical protein